MSVSTTDGQLVELFLGRDARPDPLRLERLMRWVEFRNSENGRKVLTREMATDFQRWLQSEFAPAEAAATVELVTEFNQWLVDAGVNSVNVFGARH